MRFSSCIILICLFSIACKDPNTNKDQEREGWVLDWQDEFDYTGLPDSTKWGYDVGGHGWGNNELQYYTHARLANAEVSNGTLKIRTLKEQMEGKEYTSARLSTKGKKGFLYGRIDIKAKLAPGRGLWPAVWMLGDEISTTGWPEAGEIDIMEHVGFEKDSVFGTVHTTSYNHIIGTQKGKKMFINDPYGSFHLFSLVWTPERMDFLLDDQLLNSFANEHKTNKEWPFDKPFHLLMNIAVGGGLGGQKGIDSTVFPGVLEIDYVRAYKQKK
jgi:beta-glucanase (GH16 family)